MRRSLFPALLALLTLAACSSAGFDADAVAKTGTTAPASLQPAAQATAEAAMLNSQLTQQAALAGQSELAITSTANAIISQDLAVQGTQIALAAIQAQATEQYYERATQQASEHTATANAAAALAAAQATAAMHTQQAIEAGIVATQQYQATESAVRAQELNVRSAQLASEQDRIEREARYNGLLVFMRVALYLAFTIAIIASFWVIYDRIIKPLSLRLSTTETEHGPVLMLESQARSASGRRTGRNVHLVNPRRSIAPVVTVREDGEVVLEGQAAGVGVQERLVTGDQIVMAISAQRGVRRPALNGLSDLPVAAFNNHLLHAGAGSQDENVLEIEVIPASSPRGQQVIADLESVEE